MSRVTISPKKQTNGLFSVATEVPASEVDFDLGWKLYSACPVGGVWTCGQSAGGTIASYVITDAGDTVTFTTLTPHGLTNGQSISVSGVSPYLDGNTYTVAGATASTFQVTQAVAGTITNKQLTSNIATLTSVHSLLIGDVVVVAGVDATFNGTFTVTAVNGGTFSYAKVAADVASTASGGTYTVGRPSTVSTGNWSLAGATAVKATPAVPQGLSFAGFQVYQTTRCKAGTSRMPGEAELIGAMANEDLTMNLEGWVSYALENGVTGATGLFAAATDVTPGGVAQPFKLALAILLRARGLAGQYDKPIIHIPNWAGFFIDPSTFANEVVDFAFGPGYGVTTLTDLPADTDVWAYATGPIEYALGDKYTAAPSLVERRQNIEEVIPEQFAIFRYDPCSVFKIKVTLA